MPESRLISYEPINGLSVQPAVGNSLKRIALDKPLLESGLPLMQALSRRQSTRQFADTPLTARQLSELLWAADGINREASGGRTAPSPHSFNEIDIYAALPSAVYRYDAQGHCLVLKRAVDARNLTGYQDFVGRAPLDLVYVVNHGRLLEMPIQQRDVFSAATAGAIAQNVYLYCASAGLATVVRGWLNRRILAEALSLNEDEIPILAQTVGIAHSH